MIHIFGKKIATHRYCLFIAAINIVNKYQGVLVLETDSELLIVCHAGFS